MNCLDLYVWLLNIAARFIWFTRVDLDGALVYIENRFMEIVGLMMNILIGFGVIFVLCILIYRYLKVKDKDRALKYMNFEYGLLKKTGKVFIFTSCIIVLTIYLLVVKNMRLPIVFLWLSGVCSFMFLISIGMGFGSALFSIYTAYSFLKKGYI